MNKSAQEMIDDLNKANDLIYKTYHQAIKNNYIELIPILDDAKTKIKLSLDWLSD